MKPDSSSSLPKPDIPAAPPDGADAEPGASHARPDCLALDLGDFVSRIPRCYLKAAKIDLHKPLPFDLGEVADRIAKGITTIPLATLMKMAPEIFEELAQVERALEIRFPWQKVMALMNESNVAAPEMGQATLAQRLQQRRTALERVGEPTADGVATPPASPSPSRIKGRAGADRANVWFSPTKAAGGAQEAQVSADAVALDDRPTGGEIPSPAIPPLTREPVARSPKKPQAPVEMPDLLFHESPPAEAPATERDPRVLEAKIRALEAQLATLSSERKTEAATLRADSKRLVEEARAEARRMEAQLAAEFSAELERLIADQAEPATHVDAGHKVAASDAVLVAECERLRAERAEAVRNAAAFEAALASNEAELASLKTEYESAISASEEAWEKAISMIAEEDDSFTKEKEALTAKYEQRLAKLTQDYEADLSALRSEANRVQLRAEKLKAVEEERDRFAAALSRQDQAGAIRTAALQADLAAARAERDDLLTERSLTATLHGDLETALMKAKAEAESKLQVAIMERDAARAELREVETLLTAESIFREERSTSPFNVETFLESLRQRRLQSNGSPSPLMTEAA